MDFESLRRSISVCKPRESFDFRRHSLWIFLFTIVVLFFTVNLCQIKSSSFLTSLSRGFYSNPNQSSKTKLTKVIVVSHFNEDLDWLDLFIGETIEHIVYTRSSNSLVRHGIAINKGREAVAYLRYIVDHYSSLPDVIAFVHAHRTSWHQKNPSDIVVALRALRWNKYAYMPLTSAMTQAYFQSSSTDPQVTVNYQLWTAVLQSELGPPPAQGTRCPCCASFAVRRQAILKHPKAFYSKIIDYIVASPHSDQLTGRTLEYTWHVIFGERPNIQYQPCDLFFCDSTGTISVALAENSTA